MRALDPNLSRIRDESGPAAAHIARIAQRQHGVIAQDQLSLCGLGRSTIYRWIEAGHLHRLHRGVYAVGHPNIAREGQYMAAVLAGGRGAALSHTPAARHLGLERTAAIGTIHLTLPRGNKRSPREILVHRPRMIEPRDILRRRGIPTTTATRTLFDLASFLSVSSLRNHFERAEYLETLDRPRLAELLSGATGRKGLGDLRILAGYSPLPLSRIRSGLERIILSVCRTHSLPLPAVNVPLLDYEVDFLWPGARFVVEADGAQHTGAQRAKDNERDVILARAGYLVRRYSEEALADGPRVAAEILEILDERLSSPAPRRSTR